MDENKRQFALISAARNSLDIVTAFFDDETDAYKEMVQEVADATNKDSVDRFLGDVPQEDGQIMSRSAWAESRHDGTIQWEIVEVPRQTEPKKNKNPLRRMCADVFFDRKVDKDVHYVCPGGYGMYFGGRRVSFDFENFYVTIDDADPRICHCKGEWLFNECYEEADSITPDDARDLEVIDEFCVYTGEYDEPELNPVELLSLSFEFLDGTVVDATDTDAVRNFSFVPKKRTRLYAERTEGLCVTDKATVDILHDKGIDLLKRMDECFSDWYKTPKGRKAWEDSCHDLNIGDMLTGGRPDDAFTKKYGFVILPEDGTDLLSISYDRVFGNKEED